MRRQLSTEQSFGISAVVRRSMHPRIEYPGCHAFKLAQGKDAIPQGSISYRSRYRLAKVAVCLTRASNHSCTQRCVCVEVIALHCGEASQLREIIDEGVEALASGCRDLACLDLALCKKLTMKAPRN